MCWLAGSRLAKRAVLALLVVHCASWEAGPLPALGVTPARPRPKLHALTYANMIDSRLSLPLASADRHGFFPVVVGYGHTATWAYGLSALANEWRKYVFSHTQPDDLVLFFDAFDIIFQGGEDDIIDRYLQMEAKTGHQLFYNADMACTNPCDMEKPKSSSPWAYLNSGVYLGRAHVIRELYRDPLPDPLLDAQGKPMRLQYWHVLFYWAHRDKVTVDDQCELSQVVINVDNLHVNQVHIDLVDKPGGSGLILKDGRIFNTITNTTPLILHFPGGGHWPDFRHPTRVGTCAAYEFFRNASQPELALAMEKEAKGNFIGLKPWKAICAKFTTGWDTAGMFVSNMGDNYIWCWWNLPFVELLFILLVMLLIGAYVARSFYRLSASLRDKAQ